MTSQATQEMQFRHKALEQRLTPEGGTTYKEPAYPPYGQGWSKFPIDMFLHGTDGKAIAGTLAATPEGQVVRLVVERAKLKQGKQDDGLFGSYFWNVVGLGREPNVIEPPLPVQRDWNQTQDLIAASWAIGQAVQVVVAWHAGHHQGSWTPETWETLKQEISGLAPKFLTMRDWLAKRAEHGPPHAQGGPQEPQGSPPDPEDVEQDSEAPERPVFASVGEFMSRVQRDYPGITVNQVCDALGIEALVEIREKYPDLADAWDKIGHPFGTAV